MKVLYGWLGGLLLMVFAMVARADPIAIDVTEVVAQIGVVPAAVALIALAVLTVIAVIKAYKWVRRAF